MTFTDQLNRTIELRSFPPKRIISLVPSQTELLFDLGLDEEVIGITKFCVHPEHWFRSKKRIGGTKKLNLRLIHQLQPDLIIANKEENLQVEVEELSRKFPVWISDIKNLEDAFKMIKGVGDLVGREGIARKLISGIKSNFSKSQISNLKYRTAYLIWRDPYMTVGGDTFISDMMKTFGLQNIFESERRYPVIRISQLSSAFAEARPAEQRSEMDTTGKSVNCQLLLLSSEPYPFKEKHIEEFQAALPNIKILLVDGEMFSWYGSRLQYAPDYFSQLRELIYNP